MGEGWGKDSVTRYKVLRLRPLVLLAGAVIR